MPTAPAVVVEIPQAAWLVKKNRICLWRKIPRFACGVLILDKLWVELWLFVCQWADMGRWARASDACNFEPQQNLVLSRFISEKLFSMHQTRKEFLQTVSTYQPVTLSTRSTRHKGIQMIPVFMQANSWRIEENLAERWKLELITGTASIFSHRWGDAELSFFFGHPMK